MKATSSLLLFCSIATLFFLTNCGGSSPAPEPLADQQFTKLAKSWKVSTGALSVTLDGTDRTTEYASMVLTISGTKGTPPFSYSLTGRPALSPWPASGTWVFGTKPETQIVRDTGADLLNMTYTVDGSNLQIKFDFTGTGYNGRVNQIGGSWIFNFTAQ